MQMKQTVCAGIGVVGGTIAALLGGWDAAIATLLLFMAVDYASGLVVAGVFHASSKSEGGALQSGAGFQGLCRKGMTLLFVLVACRLDMLLNIRYMRDAVIIGFSANELISIVENAGLMGLPLPAAITQAVDILSRKAEGENDHE